MKKSTQSYTNRDRMRIKIHPDFIHFSNFIESIPSIFQNSGESIYEGRNSVKKFSFEGDNFIVKRFKRPNIIQSITYSFFKKSKAERAFLYAGIFRERGIDTPHEIAFIEKYKNGILSDSYFISKECNYPSLIDNISIDTDKELITELAAFFVKLHEKKIFHGDLNLSNILYDKVGNKATQFTLIDTNRSIIGANDTEKNSLSNLVRVTHNREILSYIILQYITIRGWEYEKSANFVFSKLDKFEKKKALKRRIKSFIYKQKSK